MKSQISVSLFPRDAEGGKVLDKKPLQWGISGGSQMGEWMVNDICREITKKVPVPRKEDVIEDFFGDAND